MLAKLGQADWAEVEEASVGTNFSELLKVAQDQQQAISGVSLLGNHLAGTKLGSSCATALAHAESIAGPLPLSVVRPVKLSRSGGPGCKSGNSNWKAWKDAGRDRHPNGMHNWSAHNRARGAAKAKAKAQGGQPRERQGQH